MEVDGQKIETFVAYHWLIRPDGTAERLLKDTDVGWHSGNWDCNCRSIAICFDGDMSQEPPTDAALKACAKLIADYAKQFELVNLLGHQDVKSTVCPGSWWKKGGKEKLLAMAGVPLP